MKKRFQRTGVAAGTAGTSDPRLSQSRDVLVYQTVSLIYVFLFAYTGYSKMMDIAPFIKGIGRVPILGSHAAVIGWGIPALELLLALGMVLPSRKLRHNSLKASVALMGAFTAYLLLMIAFVREKLCHCGGVIGSMGWEQHLAFNIIILMLGMWAIRKNN
ncbi:MauE/DoxX family redox-associated membrane protein [Sphingobacterium daejeonense]|uniref:MauE/DoxX family redox-associated membrane protein n=1 Tax=Sphingobacterium daejeonense TaxID=371142 RepID=UPI003D315F58